MNESYINDIANMVCRAATQAALSGYPLRSVQWIPPNTTTGDPRGTLVLVPADNSYSSC